MPSSARRIWPDWPRSKRRLADAEFALDHIEQLLAMPAGHVISAASLRFDPAWDSLRKNPRFEKLVADAEAIATKPQPGVKP
jgi:hypothetical protein